MKIYSLLNNEEVYWFDDSDRLVVHPDYDADHHKHDLGLIKTKNSAPLSSKLQNKYLWF